MCCGDINYELLALRFLLAIGLLNGLDKEKIAIALSKACESDNILPNQIILQKIETLIKHNTELMRKLLKPYLNN
jgi:hypothetical protein